MGMVRTPLYGHHSHWFGHKPYLHPPFPLSCLVFLIHSSVMKMEAAGSPDMFVPVYQAYIESHL
jgi:hypothetical protein